MSDKTTNHALERLRELSRRRKHAFTPMQPGGAGSAAPAPAAAPGGQPMPPGQMAGGGAMMDPAAMGGGAMMDPAAMGGGAMDPAMMDPAMMDPAAAAAAADPGQDPVAMLQDVQKGVKQCRELLATIVDALQIQVDTKSLLEKGEDVTQEIKKEAFEPPAGYKLVPGTSGTAENPPEGGADLQAEADLNVSKHAADETGPLPQINTDSALAVAMQLFGDN